MGNEAICDLGPVQFSLSLPETWDYEIRNLTFAGTTTTDAIIFWNIAYPEDTFTLIYAPVPESAAPASPARRSLCPTAT